MIRKILLTTISFSIAWSPVMAQQVAQEPNPFASPKDLPTEMTIVTPTGLGAPLAAPQSSTPASPSPSLVIPTASSTSTPTPQPVVAKPATDSNDPNNLAYEQLLKTLVSPDQVTTYRKKMEDIKKAGEKPLESVNPTSSSISLALKPGEAPPKLRLSPGHASAVTFSDQTGAQWPVQSVTVGNPDAYQAIPAGEQGKTNMVVISPKTLAGESNLIITLVGYPVPVIFTLDTGGSSVDYRLDISIQARGPNAIYDIINGTSLPPTNDALIQGFLDGIPPKGARKVKTSNREVEVWHYQDMVFVRSRLEILSPAYVARARNVSGVNIYTMAEATVLLVSQDGRMFSVSVDQ